MLIAMIEAYQDMVNELVEIFNKHDQNVIPTKDSLVQALNNLYELVENAKTNENV